MPTWSEYQQIARGRGDLAKEFYVVESTPVASPEARMEILPRHLAYQKKIEAEGILFLAGPLSDEAGEQMSGAGLMIYRAGSLEEARAIADTDPMHQEGGRTYRIHKWLVNEGSLTLKVGFSTKGVRLE